MQCVERRQFYGKSMLITGASQGIGKSIALEASLRGISHLILTSRSRETLNRVKEEIHVEIRKSLENSTHTGNNRVHYRLIGLLTNLVVDIVEADLSSKEGPSNLIEETHSLLQKVDKDAKLDYLVLNHITGSDFGLWLTRNKDKDYRNQQNLEDMFRTNTFSYIWIATKAVNTLMSTTGHIVVVSSLAGHVGVPNTAAYSATKHALHGFFNALRVEMDIMQIDIGITLAAIGATDTEGAKQVMKQLPTVAWDAPIDAARAILRGAALKKREIFHPHHKVFPAVFLYSVVPQVIDYLLKVVNKSAMS